MATKKIYFVRHGETLANRRHVHQGPEEPLSEKGKEQAAAIARVLKDLGVGTILTSSFVRARETSEIIGSTLALPHTLLDEVVEFRRPHALYGRSHYSVASLAYLLRLYIHQTDPLWDDDGAENLFHIHQRMLNAQRRIEAEPGEAIVVVSHAIFMDMFMQFVCAERPLKLREFMTGLVGIKKIPNTGIVVYMVDDEAPQGACRWWFDSLIKPPA